MLKPETKKMFWNIALFIIVVSTCEIIVILGISSMVDLTVGQTDLGSHIFFDSFHFFTNWSDAALKKFILISLLAMCNKP